VFNISAMSFGALSANAIRALNGGAKLGGFAHDTGEGGYSPYHREMGGDIIWEIGSGYFGCCGADGSFSEERFAANAHELLRRHREGARRLAELLEPETAATRNGVPASSRAELPVT
jgi:glutamate synthase domain-containing protein 2